MLEQCSSPPTISSFHKEVTDVSIGSSFGLQEKVDENEDEEKGQKEAYNEDMCKKVTDDMQVKHADMQVERLDLFRKLSSLANHERSHQVTFIQKR